MKASYLYTGLFALAVTFAGPVGCAAEAVDAQEESSEDDLTQGTTKSNLLGEVAAIQFDDTTMGAKTKVRAVLSAMDLGSTDAMPQVATAIPRCMPSHTLAFINSSGKTIATGGLMCGAQQTTGTATAYITKGTKIYSVKADLGGVFKQVKAPTQAGDLLYGVTSITFKKPAMGLNSTATATEADSVKDALAGVGSKVTAIDPNAPVPRCIPARVITFYRGNKEAASVTTMCSADSGSTTGTLYSADDKTVGRLTLDMTKIGKVEARLRWTR